MSKLIAIVTFKKTGERLEMRESERGLCGSSGNYTKCALFNRFACAVSTESLCLDNAIYFEEVKS